MAGIVHAIGGSEDANVLEVDHKLGQRTAFFRITTTHSVMRRFPFCAPSVTLQQHGKGLARFRNQLPSAHQPLHHSSVHVYGLHKPISNGANFHTIKGFETFKSFLRNTPGEANWSSWVEIEHDVLRCLQAGSR